MTNQLDTIKYIVQLMLENRSFDQMLGFLYENNGNTSLAGQPFDGLTGQESNPDYLTHISTGLSMDTIAIR